MFTYSTKLYQKFVAAWIVTSAQHVYPVKSNANFDGKYEENVRKFMAEGKFGIVNLLSTGSSY